VEPGPSHSEHKETRREMLVRSVMTNTLVSVKGAGLHGSLGDESIAVCLFGERGV
jgi:hypothetical protein